MIKRLKSKLTFIFFLSVLLFSVKAHSQQSIPIYFPGYEITVDKIPKLGDTLRQISTNKEYFKFVFFSTKGKCYCERYLNNKLVEKGYFENSLDTLKRYLYGHNWQGQHTPMKVQRYFQPLKMGSGLFIVMASKRSNISHSDFLKDN